jgi:hypothetical protein
MITQDSSIREIKGRTGGSQPFFPEASQVQDGYTHGILEKGTPMGRENDALSTNYHCDYYTGFKH